jgi:hypothetical protein
MRWKRKAAIARICARLPFGNAVYKQGQKCFGQLRMDPRRRLAMQLKMCRWLIDSGRRVEGARCFEVGTGHIPVVPIGFFLSGAASTITADLNRRIDWSLTRATLRWIAEHSAELSALYSPEIVAPETLERRFALLERHWRNPREFLEAAGIRYLAPQDAARTPLTRGSIDCHCSVTVLEHIPPPELAAILHEARRLLSASGVALHFVDPSDHFQHQDRSITAINFLQYSEQEWARLAGNRFAYCNRMRASDVLALVRDTGFSVERCESTVDPAAMEALRNGFAVDPAFARYRRDDLCTTQLNLMLRP